MGYWRRLRADEDCWSEANRKLGGQPGIAAQAATGSETLDVAISTPGSLA